MKFYKVVSYDKKGILRSAAISIHDGGCIYKKDEWTKPRIAKSKLMVFSNKIQAYQFRAGCKNRQIWLVKVINPVICRNLSTWFGGHWKLFRKFWRMIEKDYKGNISRHHFGCELPPSATYCCDAVKLIKRIA